MKIIYTLNFLGLTLFQFSQNDTLLKGTVNLKEIVICDKKNDTETGRIISQVDKQLRPVNSAQDLLQLVPGLFTAQHAGGGKAEQIFLRGFDCDHGTDFSVNIDGMPVNIVSHAHGQGYADFHFVIPETIDKLKVFKGTYTAAYGDFATSGAGEFSTKNKIDKSMLKMDYGQFDTYRTMAMIDLLRGSHLFTKFNENFYIACEYSHTNSFLENKQNFKRYNVFSKYSGQLNHNNYLAFSASLFNSSWNASGQIPSRAVNDGAINRFGSLDPSEGGNTRKICFNSSLTTSLKNSAIVKNQAYYNHYDFNLFSNFTFFLHDSVNGDQINQQEKGRNIYGYKMAYEKRSFLFGKLLYTTAALGTRIDEGEISLAHSVKRQVLDTFSIGHLFQQNAFAYLDETLSLTEKLSLNLSTRFDYFDFQYQEYKNDCKSGRKHTPKFSPKLNVTYDASKSVQLFARAGYGFHSNDARSVVSGNAGKNIPTAFGCEAGSVFKIKNIVVNVVLWSLYLESELVYVGDEAIVEISGPTKRLGADFSARAQLINNFFADIDINYSHGRYTELPRNHNLIPLAPSLTSAGGISYARKKGFSASLRYKYMNTRPANNDNSIKALGYFLVDAVINYSFPSCQFRLSAENILNEQWNQAQFSTLSRLKNESQPVEELHYTPGTPFYLKGGITFFF